MERCWEASQNIFAEITWMMLKICLTQEPFLQAARGIRLLRFHTERMHSPYFVSFSPESIRAAVGVVFCDAASLLSMLHESCSDCKIILCEDRCQYALWMFSSSFTEHLVCLRYCAGALECAIAGFGHSF